MCQMVSGESCVIFLSKKCSTTCLIVFVSCPWQPVEQREPDLVFGFFFSAVGVGDYGNRLQSVIQQSEGFGDFFDVLLEV